MEATSGGHSIIREEDERICYKRPRLEVIEEESELVMASSSTVREVSGVPGTHGTLDLTVDTEQGS